MEGGQIMVVLIVAIVMVASIIRAKYGYSRHGRRIESASPEERAENLRLREEVKELKERLKVLERITVEKENSLSREIENLRDR
jgi:uncharacterized protein YlxW (UPF0749 family)